MKYFTSKNMFFNISRLTSGMSYACLYSLAVERHRTLAGTDFPSR